MMKTRHFVLVMLAVLIFPPVGRAYPLLSGQEMPALAHVNQVDSDYLDGREQLSRGQLDEARSSFERVLQADSQHVYALLGLAEIAFQRNDLAAATESVNRAVTLQPDSAYVQTVLGRQLYIKRDFSGAERAFLKATELDPDNVSARINLADLYLSALARPVEAEAAYQGVVDRMPQHAGAHFGLGRARVQMNKLAAAREAFAVAARLDPANPQPDQAMANVAFREARLDEALDHVEAALKRDPQFVPGLIARGDLMVAKGDLEAGKRNYLAAIDRAPTMAALYFRLGNLYQRLNEPTAAMAQYRQVIKQDPGAAQAYNNLAWLMVEQKGDLNEALDFVERAIVLAPRELAFKDTLAWVYRAKGDYAKAESELQAIISKMPEAYAYRYHLGVVRQEKGDIAGARKAYGDALSGNKVFPGAEDARMRLKALGGS